MLLRGSLLSSALDRGASISEPGCCRKRIVDPPHPPCSFPEDPPCCWLGVASRSAWWWPSEALSAYRVR
ncbi:hypothetical protein J4Q44_G00165200 [Coregonus suidteri]|uniref:Uncharacterized protein n=1 Tax=Coregonus suidteri TaxID=861788 RepID=A0AAN8QW99_9TELE